jgi:hypothetical protein
MPRLIVGVFLAVALLMLGIAAVSASDAARAQAREQSAVGRVVDIAVYTDRSGAVSYYPVVAFYLPDETVQTVQMPVDAAGYTQGQQVNVLYDPEQPRSARLASAGGGVLLWIVPIITGIIGLAFMGATFFSAWVIKSELD